MTEHPTNLIYFGGTYDDLAAEVARAPGLVVAEFGAVWCPPCCRLAAQLPAVAQTSPRVTFLKIDIDQCRELVTHYAINSIPQTRFLRAGDGGAVEELAVVTGADFPLIHAKLEQFA
jgi:thioredoxin 1